MPLTLSIVDADRMSVSSEDSQKVFVCQGGTIGRSLNDGWVLPDAQRYISNQHAVIDYSDGEYYLTDTSTNGVYLNEDDAVIGRDQRIKLSHGDHVHIGEYDIVVALQPEISGQNNDINSLGSSQAAGIVNTGGIPDDLDPLALFGSHDSVTNSVVDVVDITARDMMDHTPHLDEYFAPPEVVTEKQIPDDWALAGKSQQRTVENGTDKYKPALSSAESPLPLGTSQHMIPPSADTAPQIPDDWHQVASADTPSGKPLSVQKEVPVTPPEQVDEVAMTMSTAQKNQTVALQVPAQDPVPDKEYEKLLHTLGIESKDIPAELAAELPTVIGLLVRECVSGLIEVLMARTQMKSAFRVDQTMIQPVENNPLKFSVGVDEALSNMLLNNNSGYKPGLDAVKEGFEDVKAHQMATMAGMQGALQDVMKRFDPEAIEQDMNDAVKGNILFSINRKTKYWEHYKVLYDCISQEANDNFQNLLGESFMRAYEDQVRRVARAGRDPKERG